jgi:hypothetical protein
MAERAWLQAVSPRPRAEPVLLTAALCTSPPAERAPEPWLARSAFPI